MIIVNLNPLGDTRADRLHPTDTVGSTFYNKLHIKDASTYLDNVSGNLEFHTTSTGYFVFDSS